MEQRLLIIGTLTANGDLSIRGGNGITDSGVITVSGTSLFNSDVTAKVITLDSSECDDRCCEYNSYGCSECRD